MSIIGVTIDYGPFGFMDYFDVDHICNSSGIIIILHLSFLSKFQSNFLRNFKNALCCKSAVCYKETGVCVCVSQEENRLRK